MMIELVQVVVRAAAELPTNWASWAGVGGVLIIAGALALGLERGRRRTYCALLDGVTPGTILVDRSRRRREISVAKMPDWQHRYTYSPAARGGVDRELPLD